MNDFSDAMMDVIRTIDLDSMKVDAKIWISAKADGGLLRAEYDWNDSFSADRFIAYYESNGWRVGRNPMKDWRAAVRTWERGTDKQPETERRLEPAEADLNHELIGISRKARRERRSTDESTT